MTQESLKKSSKAFRTIGEVAEYLNVEQHVLRFWETKFSQIKPLKRGGGRRYYRPEDVAVVERVHSLLYKEGYTIKGAQNVLKGTTRNKIALAANDISHESVVQSISDGLSALQKKTLEDTLQTLKSMRQALSVAS
jgi:DNA-binding transcriptional MerR regulator